MGGKNIHNATSMVFSAHSIIFKPQHYEKINLINLHRIDNGDRMPGARGRRYKNGALQQPAYDERIQGLL